jgi:hypothetical protein
MGTICAHPNEAKEDNCNETADTNKKTLIQLKGTLGNHAHVELILGSSIHIQDTIANKKAKVYWSFCRASTSHFATH